MRASLSHCPKFKRIGQLCHQAFLSLSIKLQADTNLLIRVLTHLRINQCQQYRERTTCHRLQAWFQTSKVSRNPAINPMLSLLTTICIRHKLNIRREDLQNFRTRQSLVLVLTWIGKKARHPLKKRRRSWVLEKWLGKMASVPQQGLSSIPILMQPVWQLSIRQRRDR